MENEKAKCKYCGEERLMKDLRKAKVTFRNSRTVWKSKGYNRNHDKIMVRKREQFTDSYVALFCKDKQCARNEQFSNEG